MARKKKQPATGAPEWMVTYGDMMGLLLCFFVILVSMSEMKEDQKFQKVRESIRRAFGYRGGAGYIPGDQFPTNTLEQNLTNLVMRKWQLQLGQSAEEGIEGQNSAVVRVREGLEFIIGGRISFEPGRAELLQDARKHLDNFAEQIRGMNNKIRIRGHTARIGPDLYLPFRSLDELTWARAETVKKYLVACGIRQERISTEACADNEPLALQAYDPQTRSANDRVSIIVTENLVQDFHGESDTADSNLLDEGPR